MKKCAITLVHHKQQNSTARIAQIKQNAPVDCIVHPGKNVQSGSYIVRPKLTTRDDYIKQREKCRKDFADFRLSINGRL